MTTGVTLTGDNNYSGTYDSIDVLGGANYGGHDDFDAKDGNEVFMFGNLQYKSTTITDTSYDGDGNTITSGTYQSTATGTSNDTLHFHFTFHEGSAGGTSNFLTDAAPQDYTADTDGDANYQAQSDASAWNTNYATWHAAELALGATFSDPTTIETGVNNGHPDPDVNLTLDITANLPGTPATLTADNTGDKTLLGFSVGSDHIALDGVDESKFDQYFTINSSTHTSANNNTVNDTVISLGAWTDADHTSAGGWAVDLYGVNVTDLQAAATTAGETLQHYVYTTIVSA
jgi:hypothetical protein